MFLQKYVNCKEKDYNIEIVCPISNFFSAFLSINDDRAHVLCIKISICIYIFHRDVIKL